MRRFFSAFAVLALALSSLFATALPASADHTDPTQQLSPIERTSGATPVAKKGNWEHIANFPANPGTDLELFRKDGLIYSSSGTLGQGPQGHVGQRLLRLTRSDGSVAPRWYRDHGSAACDANNTSVTSLQHDVQVTPKKDPRLLIDTVDTRGRCHDTPGGGLELINISGIDTRDSKPGFKPREVHLTRHNGTSHTVTADATRPNILYNNSSEFGGMPWIDVLDVSSCLGTGSLGVKRAACRPEVFRIPFQAEWSSQKLPDGTLRQPASCHDITARGTRIYCAALNATLIFDTAGMTRDDGSIRGTPLPCTVGPGTRTKAMVTDCALGGQTASGDAATAAWVEAGSPRARGWRFLGSVNHPGRNDQSGGTSSNTNTLVPSDEGVAVSHEADPSHDGNYMFVTDERGGGVVPGGATCQSGIDNPYGNGGLHVFDISDPANPKYALDKDGNKAVFISDDIVTAPTFCTIHVIEHIPGENRLVIAWYSQGIKVVDYHIDENGRFSFEEVANYTLPNTELWAAERFKTVRHADGTRTYYMLTSDIARGIDVVSLRIKPNPTGAARLASSTTSDAGADAASTVALLALPLPLAAAMGRRRRTRLAKQQG